MNNSGGPDVNLQVFEGCRGTERNKKMTYLRNWDQVRQVLKQAYLLPITRILF